MHKSQFKEEQIPLAVEPSAARVSISELCRKYGVSLAAFYGWRHEVRRPDQG